MIKTLLKHIIAEYAIDSLFNNIQKNFHNPINTFNKRERISSIRTRGKFCNTSNAPTYYKYAEYLDCIVVCNNDVHIIITYDRSLKYNVDVDGYIQTPSQVEYGNGRAQLIYKDDIY